MATLTKKITFRVTDDEWNAIITTAESLRQTPSEYVRQTALNRPTQIFYDPDVSAMIKDLSDSVRYIASDIQQAAQKVGSDENMPVVVSLRIIEDSLREINIKLRVTTEQLSRIKGELINGNNQTPPD